MDIHQLIEGKLKGIKILVEKGAENIRPALSDWLGTEVELNICDVQAPPLCDVVSKVGYEGEKVVAVLSQLEGGICGYLLFIFPCDTGLSIVNRVLKKNNIPVKHEWDPLAVSTMEETANIVGSAFINGLASFLDISIVCKSPNFTIDYTSSIIEFMLIEDAIAGDFALFFKTEFKDRQNIIDGHLILIPTPESVPVLIKDICSA